MPVLLALFLLLFAAVAQAEALEDSQPTPATVVKGDVLYWEGEELIVKEISGREVRLHVTAETKIDGVAGRLKTGDKIAGRSTPRGLPSPSRCRFRTVGPASSRPAHADKRYADA